MNGKYGIASTKIWDAAIKRAHAIGTLFHTVHVAMLLAEASAMSNEQMR